jgi:micrococcal nuclease
VALHRVRGFACAPGGGRPGRALLVAATLIALLAAGCRGSERPRSSAPSPTRTAASATPTPPARARETARVLRVIDGDTILVALDGREERVRYIGVDTPETVAPDRPVGCFGKEASEANRALVEGRTVELERDVSERDRFGRLLRYVYADGVSVNEELVRRGYATAVTFPPDVREADRLRSLERAAREGGRGLWGACRR